MEEKNTTYLTEQIQLLTKELAEIKIEIIELKAELVPMNRALKYKVDNFITKGKKVEMREKIRARKLLKSRC